MSFKLTIGRVARAAIDLYTNEAIVAIEGRREQVDDRWLYHVLPGVANGAIVDQAVKGATLNKSKLERLILSLPPISEQRKIADVLDAIDDAICSKERVIAKLERAKLGLIRDLIARHTGGGGSTHEGRTPEWQMLPLESVAEVSRGKFTARPRNDPRYYGGEHPFIQTGDIVAAGDEPILEASQSLNDLGASVSSCFPAGTIAVTIAANIGDTATLGRPMYFPDSIVGVVVQQPHVGRFIELCLRLAKPLLEAGAPESAQKNINLQDLRPLLIPVPEPAEQHRIARAYESFQVEVRSVRASLEKQQAVKQGLVSDLLTGRVRVKADLAG
jgi:type I restriction enzyme S subunit